MEQELKKRCPACGEEILAVAIKCKHCGERFGSTRAAGAESARGAKPVPGPRPIPHWKVPLYFWLGSLPGLCFLTFFVISALVRADSPGSHYMRVGLIVGPPVGAIMALLPAVTVGVLFTLLYPRFFTRGYSRNFIIGATILSSIVFMVEWTALEPVLVSNISEGGRQLRDDSVIFARLWLLCTVAAGVGSVALAKRKTPQEQPSAAGDVVR